MGRNRLFKGVKMSKLSLFTQIKTFIASHLVPVIITSTVVVVGITAGVVAIAMSSSSEQNVSDASEPTLEQNNDSKSEDTKTDNSGNNSDSSNNQISEDKISSDTQKPTETSKPTASSNQTTNNQPSQSQSETNSSSSSSTQTPTQPAQPAQPAQPTTPVDNRVWGMKPYFYKENGIYYCPDGTREEEPYNYVDCASKEQGGCGYFGEIPDGYKAMYCYIVPEDF